MQWLAEKMKFHSLFSYMRVYNTFKIFGLCTFVWPFPWKNKILRTPAKIIYYYLIAIDIFVLIIPIFLFILFNIHDDEVNCIGTIIIGLIGFEANLSQVYCKVKDHEYKVRGGLFFNIVYNN